MIADSVKFRGYRCFQEEFSGFDEIKPINVIIGRNNSGKSHLLELVRIMTSKELPGKTPADVELRCEGVLEEKSLIPYFPANRSGGSLGGHHWNEHGSHFVGASVLWEARRGKPQLLGDVEISSRYGQDSTNARIEKIKALFHECRRDSCLSLR